MMYIDERKIEVLLKESQLKLNKKRLDAILEKSLQLQRLSLEEVAILLSVDEPDVVEKIFQTAARVKDAIYGKRVVLFAPLYISNFCANSCLYCAFNFENRLLERKALTIDEIKEETLCLLQQGHKRILVIGGESAPEGQTAIDYFESAVKAVYGVSFGSHKIRRVNVNCAPLSVEEFRRLKKAGIGTYQLFQETYHEATYQRVHPKGPKKDADNRLVAVNHAFEAGIDDVGVGVLYGLYDFRFETLAMLMHIEALEKKFNVGPHTISIPRLEPAVGLDFYENNPNRLSDMDFMKVTSILRLAVPYTGIILSTRETPSMRDKLFGLGVSQVSAASKTSPGGYTSGSKDAKDGQFVLSDHRSLDEVVGSLIDKDFIPSFCAACYRKERTGEAFMNLAKPGEIKGKCTINALVTLKEYLDDFASQSVKEAGCRLIEKTKSELDKSSQEILSGFFENIQKGSRDAYV
jgi:2-iminoacetate synthase